MEKLGQCDVVVNNISQLDEIPIVTGKELQEMFDKTGADLKIYLNSILIPKINDEIIKGIDENNSSIENIKSDISNISNNVDNTIAKIYIGESASQAVDTSPKIIFSKTIPTTSNYGANLPIGSIVFVY